MAQIPDILGDGGSMLSGSSETALKSLLNGLAADIEEALGDAPETIASPLATAVPASTSPVATPVPTITSPLGTATPALTYSTPGAQLDDLTMLRTRVDALTTENAQLRSYVESIRGDLVIMRSYMVAVRQETVALRAFQTARSGITLRTTYSSDYTP